MIDPRNAEISLQPFRWLENFGRRMRQAMGGEVTEYPVIQCDQCHRILDDDGDHEYVYPDWNDEYTDPLTVDLCDHCATGMFCLNCHTFTGGTEDIFIYGAMECSFCQGWQDDEWEWQEEYYYDDEYDDYVTEDGHYMHDGGPYEDDDWSTLRPHQVIGDGNTDDGIPF